MSCPSCNRLSNSTSASCCDVCLSYIYCNHCGAKFCSIHQRFYLREHMRMHEIIVVDEKVKTAEHK
jgi:hypothetical protein